jgi:DNA-binding NtrC family response regulator
MGTNGKPEPWPSDRPEQAEIAIIEDNLEIAELYVMLVQALGMGICFVAHDGDEAVKAFMKAADGPDVVLIDHRMPIKSGLQAMKEMLACRPGSKFIFISADEGMKAETMAAGAAAFLTKPVGLKEIEGAIKEALFYRERR